MVCEQHFWQSKINYRTVSNLNMISHIFNNLDGLCCNDIILLETIFQKELSTLFPVPATIQFWHNNFSAEKWEKRQQLNSGLCSQFSLLCINQSIKHIDEYLFIPLQLRTDEHAGILIKDVDIMILEKMSPEYLLELKEEIQVKLLNLKSLYIEPLSGQYNIRALKECLQSAGARSEYNFLFFISFVFRRKSAVVSIQNSIRIVDLLKVITEVPVFNFADDIVALVINHESSQSAYELSRKLIKRLKREGAIKVNVGFTPFEREQKQDDFEEILESGWKALSDAEKRGPFSMCSSQPLDNQKVSLVGKTDPVVMSQLQKSWKKLIGFCLVLFYLEKIPDDKFEFETALQSLYPDDMNYIKISDREGCLLIAEPSESQIQEYVRKIHQDLQADEKTADISLGVCSWPCLKYPKTSILNNCRKALLHGFFSGSGVCTFFNHISLNVSGDYFFDEGDFRQALKDYQMGLCLEPSDINLMNSLGVTLTEMNRLKSAVDWFAKVLQKDENNYMALVNLGFAKRMLQADNEALFYFEKAFAVADDLNMDISVDVIMQLGKLYCKFTQYHKAVKVLESWDKEEAANQEFYLYRLLGEAYMESGRQDEGMQALQRALKIHPRNAESMSLLGLLYYEAGQGDDIGVRLCIKAVEMDALNAGNWYRLARIYFHQQNISKALEAIRKSIHLKRTDNFRSRLLLGRIYEHERQFFLAGKIYNGVLKTAKRKDNFMKEAKHSLARISAKIKRN